MNSQELIVRLISNLGDHLGDDLVVTSPVDGAQLTSLAFDSPASIEVKIHQSVQAFRVWRDVPAPKRGELIRQFGNKLRERKEELSTLVSLECGKILEESRGEVQEMIDICDFAVGISRQLYGLTIASERKNHVMHENWLPLGPVGIISAFNFPVAVWAWNAALAIVCGDSVIWKPSEKTPLTALACQSLLEQTCKEFGDAPAHLSQVIIGAREQGEQMVEDPRVPLISATGSTRMGQAVGQKVAARFGKSLLELGGNNAMIIAPSADLAIAIPSILFGSVGTAGQRCTTTRRVFLHASIFDQVYNSLKTAYVSLGENKVGSPLEASTLVGPLIDEASFSGMQNALARVKPEAVEIIGGERVDRPGYYVKPALVRLSKQSETIFTETFAPITYVMPYDDLSKVIEDHNAVPQGLSSAIMTTDVREAEFFKRYSDCGIANVNIGTSGAEIGGAFGGEKETGGGRESGSDSWKAYMRRQTSTTYFGTDKPALAQGIKFDI